MSGRAHIIIQARQGSSRLPNKMSLPFYESKSILEIIIERLLEEFKADQIILATTTSGKDDILVDYAKNFGIPYFRGSESNVLERFINAGKVFKTEYIVRVCADNPFIDIQKIKELSNKTELCKDYVGYLVNKIPSIKTHYGLWGELVKLSALEKVSNFTNDKLYLEHVTNYIYSHHSSFEISWIEDNLEEKYKDIRLTVDIIDDFKLSAKIYSDLKKKRLQFTKANVLEYVVSNKEYLDIMKHNIDNNIK